MAIGSQDLFDDGTMSFGDHLEVLRVHVWKAILGIALAVGISLLYGRELVALMRQPIDAALAKYGDQLAVTDDLTTDEESPSFWEWTKGQFGFGSTPEAPPEPEPILDEEGRIDKAAIDVEIDALALAEGLHALSPEDYPKPPEGVRGKMLPLKLRSPEFTKWKTTTEEVHRPVTLNVQEAFMTYIKVSMIAGLVLSSPWVFYQIWMFVAAGLYKHERKFVYLYGILSLTLFLIGFVFCFKLVFPYVLDFLLSFNLWMGLTPQIRLSEWVSFAVMLPLMFGVSFQLPLVMRFLQALSIFSVASYREKRRMSILVIAALSMFLTPADPMSMLLMMFPLIFLYEMGIWLCQLTPAENPFEAGPV
ncbi:MAG: twin-arginine translocase subunit TatC [Planctomycetaceae bacterium]